MIRWVSRFVAGLLLLLAAPASLSAQVVFTVTATANATALGYTASQSVAFTFVLHDFSPAVPAGGPGSTYYLWMDDFLTDPELWTSVSGTGLGGTWSRPNASNTAPFSKILASSPNALQLYASHEGGVTGLTVNGVALQSVDMNATYTGLAYPAFNGSSLPDPTAFFSTLPGTYLAASTSTARIYDDLNNSVTFTITGLTISAIPEPSICAFTAALGALGFVAWRRRQQKESGCGY